MHFVRDWKTIRTLNREAFKLTIDPINRSLAVILDFQFWREVKFGFM